MKNPNEIVQKAKELHKTMSLRKTAKRLEELYGISINYRSVKRWTEPKKPRKYRTLAYTALPCPNCGSTNTRGHGYHETKAGLTPRRVCRGCGKYYTNFWGAPINK